MDTLGDFREFCEAYNGIRQTSPEHRLERFMARVTNDLLSDKPPKALSIPSEPPMIGPKVFKIFRIKESGKGHIIYMTPHATTVVMDDAEYRARKSMGTDPRVGDTVRAMMHLDGSFASFKIIARAKTQ